MPARLFIKDVKIAARIPLNTPKFRQKVQQVNRDIIKEARSIAPYKTGWRPPGAPHIRDSFESEVRARGQFLEGVVRNTAPHAKFVHGGAKPHSIVAHSAPQLVFWWENANTWFRGPSVKHPGQEPNPFLLRAARNLGYDVGPPKFPI